MLWAVKVQNMFSVLWSSCDINQKYVLIMFVQLLLSFWHASHVSHSLFTQRLSDNIFQKPYIRCSYFHFSLMQLTLLYSRRKMKRVRWFVCRWLVSASHTLFIRSIWYFVSYQMFYPRLAKATPAYPSWCSWKYYKFKSPQNRNPFVCWG